MLNEAQLILAQLIKSCSTLNLLSSHHIQEEDGLSLLQSLTAGKGLSCRERFIDDLHLEYFQSFIIWFWKKRHRLLSSLTISSKTNGCQSPIVQTVFCRLASASRLSPGVLFHFCPSFTGPRTPQPHDITCGTRFSLTLYSWFTSLISAKPHPPRLFSS